VRSIQDEQRPARGAYGREANLQDWEDGKDFRIVGGPYFSIRDMDEMRRQGINVIDFLNNQGYTAFFVELR
jgi:hypothetical protein